MTIFAARLSTNVAAVSANSVESRGLDRGVCITPQSNYVARCCCTAFLSSRIVSQARLPLSPSSHTPPWRNRSSNFFLEYGTVRIERACPRSCRSRGELFVRTRERKEQSIAAAGRIVNECPLCRNAIESKSQVPASCVFALGTMYSGGDGWKRASPGGALERQCRKISHAGEAFTDDDKKNEASLFSAGNSKIVTSSLPPTKLLTLPTILTLARVAAVPAILAVFYCKETWATGAGVTIFILAAVTDWLDGYLARKMGSSSAFGAFLDPVADKLMVAAALVLLCTRPLPISGLATTPWLLPLPTIAIIGREITMSAVREWAAAQGADVLKAVAVNNLGKIKTASQMISITLLLATGDGGLDSTIASYLGISLLYVAAGLALWSLAMYMKGIWGSLSK